VIGPDTLEGRQVRLRPVRRDDLPHFQRWLQDPEVTRFLGATVRFHPPSPEDEERWFQRIAAQPNLYVWAMETREGKLLGNLSLLVTPEDHCGRLGIFIGPREE